MTRAGWRLPGYRIEELVGSGSSGEVWRAIVPATGVAVALKKLWLCDVGQRKAALSEAAFLSTLDHPHLMKLHELRHVEDDAIVLVLDLAAGGSLASLLARRGRLTIGEVVTALAPIGAALAYAHNAGVVHGDVSAANVLFTDIGLPLLADLGVSRLLGDAAPVRTTPSYIDPHVAVGALPSTSSDVFMLGGIALHALTGAPPWPGTVSEQVLDDAASGLQPDFAGRLAAAGIPDQVATVVTRALSVEPEQRGTAADFALDLRHAAQPVAVELSAGRSRRLGGPLGVESWPLESVPAGDSGAAAAPGSVRVPAFAPQPPITYGVRAPSPFPAGRHSAPVRSRGARVAALAACALIVALIAVATAVLWPSSSTAPTIPAAARPTPSHSIAHASTEHPSADHPSSALPSRALPTIAAALARLDTMRSTAFARRDLALLAKVYDSDPLLARDSALLLSAIPAGCGLRGVRTDFTGLKVLARTDAHVRVQVRAAVHPSTLVCGGTATAHAAGTKPQTLLIDLVRVSDSFRIAGQHSA